MKLTPFKILILLAAAKSYAADLSPNKLGPLSDTASSLTRGSLTNGAYHLGLGFEESEAFVIDPIDRHTVATRVIQRQLTVAMGLPAQTEFGFALHDLQEGFVPDLTTGYAAADHSSKPLGLQSWLRWNFIQTSMLQSSVMLQYQPGLATAASFHQASQDRSTLGMDLKIQPWSWVRSAVYASYSRRHEERYRDLHLGDEKQAGLRLALGDENFAMFGESSFRHLSTSDRSHQKSQTLFARQHQLGMSAGTQTLQLSVYALIPDTNRYVGIPERGFGASLSLVLGAETKVQAEEKSEKTEDALVAQNKANQQAAQETPAPPVEVKILETNEPDEFQLLQEKANQEAIKNRTETPAEKAERELRLGLEKEKKLEAEKADSLKKKKLQDEEQLRQQIRQNDENYLQYKDNVDQEINQYTLPDQDDLNWNGLAPTGSH